MAGAFLLWAPIIFGQEVSPTPQTAGRPGVTIEEVIVTGSNIPTAEEVGPNPVDTYRTEDIERLGVRNTTDLLTKLPQEMGSSINQNIANGGGGSSRTNLRCLVPTRTFVLVGAYVGAMIGGSAGG